MKLVKGSNRFVFVIWNYVVKIPSLHSYKNFLWGLLANMQEVEFNQINEMKNKLCPIVFHLPFGFLLIMPKARILLKDEISKSELEKFCIQKSFTIPAELKHDSFGYYNGKLVAVDYG